MQRFILRRKKLKLWIDDIRSAPEGYVWCKSTNEALHIIRKHRDEITELSLDHDSGDYVSEGGDFIEVLNEMERLCHCVDPIYRAAWNCIFMNYTFRLHSANPVGVANMRVIIEKNGWKEIR